MSQKINAANKDSTGMFWVLLLAERVWFDIGPRSANRFAFGVVFPSDVMPCGA